MQTTYTRMSGTNSAVTSASASGALLARPTRCFRGLVLSTRGTGEPSAAAATATTGGEPFRRFDVVEANSVLKGFWPFFRRIRSEADYRDWVACGVFDWRALYVSSLGSQSEFHDLDEGDI